MGMKKGNRRCAYVRCLCCNARTAVYEGALHEAYADLALEAAAAWNRRAKLEGGEDDD